MMRTAPRSMDTQADTAMFARAWDECRTLFPSSEIQEQLKPALEHIWNDPPMKELELGTTQKHYC